MPDALAGVRVQTQQRVGEQVVAMPVRPVKIESRRAGRREDQSAPLIDNQPCPIVRAADVPPCVFRPRLVTEFARVRYRVKDPPLFSRANAERAYVARRGGQFLASQSADDKHVFVNGARRGVADRDLPGVAPDKTFAQIDASLLAEARRRLSGLRVERIEPMPKPEEDSLISAVFPIHHASVAHFA